MEAACEGGTCLLPGSECDAGSTTLHIPPHLDAVDACVVPRALELLRVDVDGDDVVAGHGELDGVAAAAHEAVQHHVTPAYTTTQDVVREPYDEWRASNP